MSYKLVIETQLGTQEFEFSTKVEANAFKKGYELGVRDADTAQFVKRFAPELLYREFNSDETSAYKGT